MISLFFFLFFVSGICARIGDQSVEEMSSPCLRPQRQRRVFSPQSFRAEEPEEAEEADPPQDGVDSQQPDSVSDGAGCQKPESETMTVRELCSLPPSRGTGNDDIYRYYFNPVVNQCLPFSYTGKGGNSNRFVSIKNCYEICHPSEASVKKPRVLSAIRAYLIPSRKGDECPKPPTTPAPREVVVRHIPHPLDPSKTLTIVQNAKYIERPKEFRFDDPKDTEKTRRLIQYERQ